MSKINRLLWRYISSSPTKFHFHISNSFIENRWTDKQTDKHDRLLYSRRRRLKKSGHMGVEYVLANLRAKGIWIPRWAVKSVLNACVVCNSGHTWDD